MANLFISSILDMLYINRTATKGSVLYTLGFLQSHKTLLIHLLNLLQSIYFNTMLC